MSGSGLQSLTGPCSCSNLAPAQPPWRRLVSHAQPTGSTQDLGIGSQRRAACRVAALTARSRQPQQLSRRPAARRRPCRGGALITRAGLHETLVGLGIFFTPSLVAVVYAYFKGKGNVKDGLSRMLTVCTSCVVPRLHCSHSVLGGSKTVMQTSASIPA